MILVVGGAGYIGSHVNKLLHMRKYETIVYDSLIYGHREAVKWGVFVQGDLSDKEQLRNLFQRYPITAVMHFAAFAYVGESMVNPEKYYINNVANTLNLLAVMKEFKVKTFIFSSTCATYGDPLELPITETHPQNPINSYGKSKWMVEQILRDYCKAYDMQVAILRYFNAAGADLDAELGEWHLPETHLIPLLLDVVMGRRTFIHVFGTDYPTKDGTCIRDYIHVVDLAEAHVLALDFLCHEKKSVIVNLGNGEGSSVRDVIKTVELVTGKTVKVIEMARRPGDPAILIGSSEKAQSILRWTPQYNSLRCSIDTAWKWHQHVYAKENSNEI